MPHFNIRHTQSRAFIALLAAAVAVIQSPAAEQATADNQTTRALKELLPSDMPITQDSLKNFYSSLAKVRGTQVGSVPARIQQSVNDLSPVVTALIRREPRIVGGARVTAGQAPWQVALTLPGYPVSSGFFCGGSLIHVKWILTAAHCVESMSPGQLNIYYGSLSLSGGGRTSTVRSIKIHNLWDKNTMRGDIALVELSDAVALATGQVELIPMSEAGGDPGAIQTVTGWGRTAENGNISRDLMKVNVPVISPTTCNSQPFYDGAVLAGMYCAGIGGKDSCQGDSGGPIVSSVIPGDSPKQFGVVSWGYGCAQANKPGVYTDVSSYRAWVLATLK